MLRILVVDDNKDAADSARMLIKHFTPHEVMTAYTGTDAIQKANEKPFDWVLMDIQLPDMTGFDAASKIKENSPGTKIVAMSGYPSDMFGQGHLEVFHNFLSKPVHPTVYPSLFGEVL